MVVRKSLVADSQKFTLTNLKPLEGQIDARIIQWTSVINDRFAERGQQMDFAAWSQFVYLLSFRVVLDR